MASNDYYVNASAGADTNGGTSEGSAKVAGTAGSTNGTATVTLDSGSDLSSVVVGDCIRLSAESGSGIRSSDIFEITAVDDGADTVDVTPTPGTNSGQTWAVGGAFATLGKAFGILRTADTDYVWVKGGTDYTETVDITLAMGIASPATIEGYTTTPGDGGVFTINGGAVRDYGIEDTGVTGVSYYTFKNMRVTNHAQRGMSLQMDACVCKNCQFDNNTVDGVYVDDRWRFEACSFPNNGGNGCYADEDCIFVGCTAHGNGVDGITAKSGIMFACMANSNTGDGLVFRGAGYALNVFINCTVDGDNKTTDTGIDCGGAVYGLSAAVNNIVYDCATGINVVGGSAEQFISRNNLVNGNTDNYSGGADTYTGEVTDPPQFMDEAGGDYTLRSTSPAREAGFDLGEGMDIGAYQTETAIVAPLPPVYPWYIP